MIQECVIALPVCYCKEITYAANGWATNSFGSLHDHRRYIGRGTECVAFLSTTHFSSLMIEFCFIFKLFDDLKIYICIKSLHNALFSSSSCLNVKHCCTNTSYEAALLVCCENTVQRSIFQPSSPHSLGSPVDQHKLCQ